MTPAEVFKINQEINQRLAEMESGDAETRRVRHKDIIELVTRLCVEIVDGKKSDISVMEFGYE